MISSAISAQVQKRTLRPCGDAVVARYQPTLTVAPYALVVKGMRQRLLRFNEHDDARLAARANVAGVSAQKWAREIILRELNGIDASTVLREEFARETAEIRAENERFQNQLIEIVVALRDSIRNTQAQLLDGFREAVTGRASGHDRKLRHD